MAQARAKHIIVVGAGAAGLMAASDLARAGRRVTILEARERCGGRIDTLSAEQFGYPAEGGAEFIHGEAAVTTALMREAGLSLALMHGRRWVIRGGTISPRALTLPHADRLHAALVNLKEDLTVAEFLQTYFADRQYDELRHLVRRMTEGYDAADPARASTFAMRDEWIENGPGRQARVAGGYGALIDFLEAECRRHGAAIHFSAAVTAIEESGGGIIARCHDGASHVADAAILAVPVPIVPEISLPPAAREKAAACGDIGYGNVVKILLRFTNAWWIDHDPRLADLTFIFSDAKVPTWWTQHPEKYPLLTGWYSGPKADGVAQLTEGALVDMGLASLADIFNRPLDRVTGDLVASAAINWGNDPFARGAYSYATPKTRAAQLTLKKPDSGRVFFSGEALYAGPDMGPVEAALASGRETAQAILAGGR